MLAMFNSFGFKIKTKICISAQITDTFLSKMMQTGLSSFNICKNKNKINMFKSVSFLVDVKNERVKTLDKGKGEQAE